MQQTAPGSAPMTVAVNQERAAATTALSLSAKSGGLATELSYNGEYSGESMLHGVWLRFLYSF